MSGGVLWHCLSAIVSSTRCLGSQVFASPAAIGSGATAIHPQVALDLVDDSLSTSRRAALRTLVLHGNGFVICPLLLGSHWVLLTGRLQGQQIFWTCFDGLQLGCSPVLCRFAQAFGALFGLCDYRLDFACCISQVHPHTCGAIALLHLCHAFGLCIEHSSSFVLRLHTFLCGTVVGDLSLLGFGPGPTELLQRLATLLESKGVCSNQSMSRAQSCLSKVGVVAVSKALDFKNPWGALKEAASKPGVNFRLVSQEELQAQINAKASSGFGA